MIRATVLKSRTYRRMPWKNGGGETIEIAVSPEGAPISDFDWRISMAIVATDGPFSIFAGVDRTLSILEGNGMSLAIDGHAPVLLTQESAPLAFPADVAVSAALPDGPITDLNVMTRRNMLRHRVERLAVNSTTSMRPEAQTCLLLCRQAALAVEWSDQHVELEPGDTILLKGARGVDVTLHGEAPCFLISINSL
ncbi:MULTISPECIES: HutD family protein [unclassified Rhizobium]|uniref:HutD/Ves family protein n=1 Tax=unclassified Rhizobium TaxID=2613769 RepID=UPI0016189DC4|nr:MULTISPECIES: HutD family protein [unclassified Rhizobium]MBB3318814.1 hypothetical protein [Rhizobium sp. BK181]MBB3543147.1 hypothetical protein [Rhizobium sp. BK399]MCS3742362.1 hypothetical protein [Rhizobium sp. BK661]MCS4094810.1 hypothetical protein [Rhizobium sp. BK176]